MTTAEVEEYNLDNIGYTARAFGLSVPEYREWIKLYGVALCGGRTKGGGQCRNGVGGAYGDAAEWKARHRKTFCHCHR